MEFKSLDDALSTCFIKSLPHLTRLNLTANEIKLIELVIHYTRNGNTFYMGHANIAEHLVLKDTKNKAKTVGNIIAKLKKKGYITAIQNHNFNGKNGGSSTTISIVREYLEQQLHVAFNPVEVLDQNTLQTAPELDLEPVEMQLSNATPSSSTGVESLRSSSKTKRQTADEFMAELEAMEDEPRAMPNLPFLCQLEDADDTDDDDQQEDYGYMEFETLGGFKSLLQGLMGLDQMYHKRGTLQQLIDNELGWDLDKMKEAFASTVLK